MPTQVILKYTSFNFKLTDEKGNKGYNWCDKIGMSFQSKDSNGTMFEIMNMVNVNKYNISMCIQLSNNDIIYFDNTI